MISPQTGVRPMFSNPGGATTSTRFIMPDRGFRNNGWNWNNWWRGNNTWNDGFNNGFVVINPSRVGFYSERGARAAFFSDQTIPADGGGPGDLIDFGFGYQRIPRNSVILSAPGLVVVGRNNR